MTYISYINISINLIINYDLHISYIYVIYDQAALVTRDNARATQQKQEVGKELILNSSINMIFENNYSKEDL